MKGLLPGTTNYLYIDEDGNKIVMDMDDLNNNRTYYAVTVYWYQQPYTDDLYDAYPKDELYGFYHLPPLEEA